ncbi:MAG: hypothetical protein KKB37_11170 [Alphaproteobacteria bacterium]|nr:hypothetical protein [Alphaproteobacteria bacterium]
MTVATGTRTPPARRRTIQLEPNTLAGDTSAIWDYFSGRTYFDEDIVDETSSAVSSMMQSAEHDEEGEAEPFALADFRTSNFLARLLGRLRSLRYLPAGRNGQAAPANKKSVDLAIQFVSRAEMPVRPIATLDDDGTAVIEIESEDMQFFADIAFLPDGSLEIYRRKTGEPSQTVEGPLTDDQIESFLRKHLGIRI